MVEQAGVKFSAIVLVTFSARPAHDSFRAAPQVAKALAVQGNGPVAFVCHAPGYARLIPELGRDTFPALLLEALALGIEFDQAVYYAKNRVAMRATQDSRRCFGVPGYYMVESAEGKRSARSPGSVTGRFKPGPTARPMEKPQ